MPRRLKLSPMQRDIIFILEEAGAETIGTVIATVRPSNETEFDQNVEELIRLGLVRKSGKENGQLVLTERGVKALLE